MFSANQIVDRAVVPGESSSEQFLDHGLRFHHPPRMLHSAL
jgi:hypothetical protein